ncbi:MAG: hypothetical protein IPF48_03835 [Sphingomonadales bacterium]|nr:hypothetical protein [Sphingomonadales bacterium]
MQKTLGIIFGLAIGFAQPAIASPELPSQRPEEILPLEVTADGLAGVGGERLRAELGDAQFVAVGEDHGFAGSPMLAAALGKELARVKGPPVYHVVEVGPLSTQHISQDCARRVLADLIALLMSNHLYCLSWQIWTMPRWPCRSPSQGGYGV